MSTEIDNLKERVRTLEENYNKLLVELQNSNLKLEPDFSELIIDSDDEYEDDDEYPEDEVVED